MSRAGAGRQRALQEFNKIIGTYGLGFQRRVEMCIRDSAVADGRVSPERYDSYLRLREEMETLEDKKY